MELACDSFNRPILKAEQNGTVVVIAFSEEPAKTTLKENILDLLTAAYEKRMVE